MAASRLSTRVSARKRAPDAAWYAQVYGACKASVYQGHDVRFGSKADIEARQSDVRFTAKSGHR